MTTVDQVADPVWTLIKNISNVDTFDAEDPKPTFDADDRIHAYAIYYPAAGWLHSITLDATPDLLGWTFQVTCAGGDRTRGLWCVSKVRSTLTGAWITVGGQQLQIRETGDPGPIRRDDKLAAPRFYVPLIFALDNA